MTNEIILTGAYWDCECKLNYIHHESLEKCPECGVDRESQPQSRVSEVEDSLAVILCELEMNRIGHLIITPLNPEWQRKIKLHLEYWGEKWNGEVLVQPDYEVINALANFVITQEQQQELDNGWPVVAGMEPWDFLQGYIGYDAGDDPIWDRQYCVRTKSHPMRG